MYKPIERWRQIPGFSIGYMVSDRGRIVNPSGLVRKLYTHKHGYKSVGMTVSTGNRHYYIHRLVLLCFVGPCPIGKQVNHKNGDKGDNRLYNLEYVTPSQNLKHSYQTLNRKVAAAKITKEIVDIIRSMTGVSQRVVANQFEISQQQVSRIQAYENWNG